ncbi:denD [Symbiodinium sp. CCMP2456]|nr:denD [Symbiodinium sp. CCMP2456]
MKVIITGGFGFLGLHLCKRILAVGELIGADESTHVVRKLVLFDAGSPPKDMPRDSRIEVRVGDITNADEVKSLVDEDGIVIFHLASVMSGQGEKDFDICWRVNVEGTRNLLEPCRARRGCKFVFASSGACFGERSDGPETDTTKLLPHTSYGMTKACMELVINDFTRRGFVDGRVARLPTVIPRPEPNSGLPAAFSDILRQPLQGQPAVLRLKPDMKHAVCGFRVLVRNLIHLANLPAAAFAESIDRCMNMPSLSVTLQDLAESLLKIVQDPSKLGSITYEPDAELCGKLSTFHKHMDATRARALGMMCDSSAAAIAADFAAEYVDPLLLKPVVEIYEEPRHWLAFSNEHVRVFRVENPPGGPPVMMCLDVELAGFQNTQTDGAAAKRPRTEAANLPAGLRLTKERPGARVHDLDLAAGTSWAGRIPFARALFVVHRGAHVRGELGDRLLKPGDVFFRDGPIDMKLEVLGKRRDVAIWVVELLSYQWSTNRRVKALLGGGIRLPSEFAMSAYTSTKCAALRQSMDRIARMTVEAETRPPAYYGHGVPEWLGGGAQGGQLQVWEAGCASADCQHGQHIMSVVFAAGHIQQRCKHQQHHDHPVQNNNFSQLAASAVQSLDVKCISQLGSHRKAHVATALWNKRVKVKPVGYLPGSEHCCRLALAAGADSTEDFLPLSTQPLAALDTDAALQHFWPSDLVSPKALFLDYDGTLREFESSPELAVPTSELMSLLQALNERPDLRPHIISGRSSEFLEAHFGSLNAFTLIAEHGYHISPPVAEGDCRTWRLWEHFGGDAKHFTEHKNWKAKLREAMSRLADQNPGSRLEEKQSSLVWHYRQLADEAAADTAVAKAFEDLEQLCKRERLQDINLTKGHKVLEASYRNVRKGLSCLHVDTWDGLRKTDGELWAFQGGFDLSFAGAQTPEELRQFLWRLVFAPWILPAEHVARECKREYAVRDHGSVLFMARPSHFHP